ncbi:MAG: HAMP domain-containing sensor histidine kinase [Anaerolineae bacterium]|jgi:signal transduction histidine kinase
MRNKEHWHRHDPPWRDREQWEDWWSREHGPPPHWMKHRKARESRHSHRGLFFRFSLIFGLFVLLGCGALAALGAVALLFFQQQGIPLPTPGPGPRWEALRWVLGFLAIALVLALALRRVGTIAARRITSPLSETMKAADAMAEGDLSVRVSEEGNGEFRHFARSFNRMAEALETADRQRRELLADVAHELRTPLTIIQGNLEGLRDGVYEATPEHLDLVLEETRNLGRLVDDLRLLTLAEAGQLPLDLQLLDVPQLLADVRDAFACQAGEAGIALTMEVAEPLPPLIGDPQRLGQVLGNLVTNALRHTPAGGEITVGAALASGQEGHSRLRLWIADTGEGISSEDLPRIFDRFWRGDPSRSHGTGSGSGLGLAIAKSLVEAHGGRIGAKSQLGEGTTVYCLFPLPSASTD